MWDFPSRLRTSLVCFTQCSLHEESKCAAISVLRVISRCVRLRLLRLRFDMLSLVEKTVYTFRAFSFPYNEKVKNIQYSKIICSKILPELQDAPSGRFSMESILRMRRVSRSALSSYGNRGFTFGRIETLSRFVLSHFHSTFPSMYSIVMHPSSSRFCRPQS